MSSWDMCRQIVNSECPLDSLTTAADWHACKLSILKTPLSFSSHSNVNNPMSWMLSTLKNCFNRSPLLSYRQSQGLPQLFFFKTALVNLPAPTSPGCSLLVAHLKQINYSKVLFSTLNLFPASAIADNGSQRIPCLVHTLTFITAPQTKMLHTKNQCFSSRPRQCLSKVRH